MSVEKLGIRVNDLKMAQQWLWCAGGKENIVATAVGWKLVSLQMPSAHAGFPPPPALGLLRLPSTLVSALRPRCGRYKDPMASSRPSGFGCSVVDVMECRDGSQTPV